MTKRENHPKQVVYKHKDGKTDVWEKDSSGKTTKERHTYTRNGEKYDHYGKHRGKA